MSQHVRYSIIFFIIIPSAFGVFTFNEKIDAPIIVKYNAVTNTATRGVSHSSSDFDKNDYYIFNVGASVNDFIAWGTPFYVFTNLTLNLTEPIVSTDHGIIWEYSYNYGTNLWTGWKVIPNVIDETNNFTLTGLKSIRWDINDMNIWGSFLGINFPGLSTQGSTAIYVRARIVNADTITSGGRVEAYTKMNDHTITLTDENARILDIYNADQANEWGCIVNINSYYYLNCNLNLGNSNLTIRENEMLEIGNLTQRRAIISNTYGQRMTIGYADSNGIYDGSMVKYYNHNTVYNVPTGGYNNFYGDLYSYNSIFVKYSGGFTDVAFIRGFYANNSIFETMTNSIYYLVSTSYGNIKNTVFSLRNQNLYMYSTNMIIDNIIFGYINGILAGVTGSTVENTDFGTNKIFRSANPNVHIYAVNSKFANIDAQTTAGSSNNYVSVQYDLDITLIDKDGNNIPDFDISVRDNFGSIIHNGAYTEPIRITTFRKYYSGVPPAIATYFNPITYTIKKENYIDYTSTMNLSENNRKITYTLDSYPFILNGTLNLTEGQSIKFIKCET
jgi:hypothetical protein